MRTYILILFITTLFILSCGSKPKPDELFKKFYNNGNIFCEGKYRYDDDNDEKKLRIGIWKFYYLNSLIEQISEYNDEGKLLSMKSYYETGELKNLYIDNNEITSDKYFYKNGKLKSESIKKYDLDSYDIEENITIEFNEHGNLKEEHYKWQDRKWGEYDEFETVKEYYETGQLKETRKYKNDRAVESMKIWDTTGNNLIEVWYDSYGIMK